jgi:hypothetical protein
MNYPGRFSETPGLFRRFRVIEGRGPGQPMRRIVGALGARIVRRNRHPIALVAPRGPDWRVTDLEGRPLGTGQTYLHGVALALRPRP